MSALDLLGQVVCSGGHLLSPSAPSLHYAPHPHNNNQPVSQVKWNDNRTLRLEGEIMEDKDEEEEEGGVDVETSLSHDGKEKMNKAPNEEMNDT